jgi:superfamily II DNA or RNA helicase
MSRKIHIESTELDVREQIMKDLQVRIEGSKYSNSSPSYVYPIEVGEEYAYIPFAYGRICTGGPFECPNRDTYPKIECKFDGSLREHQKVIKTEAISHLNKYGSTIIAGYPGIGKTAMAIYIATKIKLKVLIVTHRIVLINQWKQSIEKFIPGVSVQVLTSKSNKKDCDFYIMNAANVSKHSHEYYKDIGFMIIDEVHLIMAEGLSKCMQKIVPRYVMGLSATPYREDGLNILLDLYFGEKKIYRKLFREHTAYKIKTNFVPTVELASNGRVNWGVILDTQAHDKARNEMIIRLIKYFPKRVFLVLCKRVRQGNYLVQRLEEEGEDVTSLIGKQQEFDHDSRILVGINSKTGTGFDHPRLDAMILASDVQAYFIQYLGRCMRTEDVVPMVFDIVDRNPILDRHYKVRRATYLEHGGKIKDFSEEYPNFDII